AVQRLACLLVTGVSPVAANPARGMGAPGPGLAPRALIAIWARKSWVRARSERLVTGYRCRVYNTGPALRTGPEREGGFLHLAGRFGEDFFLRWSSATTFAFRQDCPYRPQPSPHVRPSGGTRGRVMKQGGST